MSASQSAVEKLLAVYNDCPTLACSRCGKCCLGPHFSLTEFMVLLQEFFAQDKIALLRHIVRTRPRPVPGLEPHIVCQLLGVDNQCQVYQGRPLCCRLDGAPAMDIVRAREASLCPPAIRAQNEQANSLPPELFEKLMEASSEADGLVSPGYVEPYFIDALNLPSWLAVCFDPKITQPQVLELRALLSQRHDLACLADDYVDFTNLAEKFNLIDHFFALNVKQEARAALDCMRLIKNGFPLTGIYFQAQAKIFIEFMSDLVVVVEAREAGENNSSV